MSDNPPGRLGNLHAVGVMIGKERKADRKTRRTFGLCFLFFWDGWTRETAGGWRGVLGALGVVGVVGHSIISPELEVAEALV